MDPARVPTRRRMCSSVHVLYGDFTNYNVQVVHYNKKKQKKKLTKQKKKQKT